MGLFGIELARLRDEQRWTPTELAEKSGVTHAAVWQWEQGRTYPARSRVKRLEELFEVSPGVLQSLVDADRSTKSTDPTEIEIQKSTPRTTVTRTRVTSRRSPLDGVDDVDDLIFTTSNTAKDLVIAMKTNMDMAEALHAEATQLIELALDNPSSSESRRMAADARARIDAARRLIEQNQELDERYETERSQTLRLIQRSRHIVNLDNYSDEVAPEKIDDVVKRRVARRTSRRRSETFTLYKEVEQVANRWFTDEATPSDVVPLLTLILNLMNRVNDLEGTVNTLRLARETDLILKRGKAAIGSAPQHL